MILTLKKEKNAVNDFDNDFFKKMINFVYGKTMENLRKRIYVRLVNNARDFYNILADRLILPIKSLVRIMPLFMKLNQL